ncbi:hypothetical protein GCM10027020_25600 [Nocardioides salsibiostraticola]
MRSSVKFAARLVVVLALIVAGLAVWRYDLADDLTDDALEAVFGPREVAVPVEPTTIAPPPGLSLPPLVPAEEVAEPIPAQTVALSRRAVRRAVAPQLADPDLGGHVLSAVAPIGTDPVYTSRTGAAAVAIPASTTKVVTSTAALLALGPDHTFETTVVPGAGRRIVLVGGGDPFLASQPAGTDPDAPSYPIRADVVTLARETAKALLAQGRRRVVVTYDDSLFTGPEGSPTWEEDYIPDGEVSRIGSLWVDEGRPAEGTGRVEDPPLTAATVFSGALSNAGVEVVGVPEQGSAPQGEVAALATVSSPPVSQIVERILDVSDNEAVEVLLRHVGLAVSGEGSFDGGRQGVLSLLEEQGVTFGSAEVLYDGSGLSRQNRLAPTTLIDVLALGTRPDLPQLRSVIAGLPVAGFTGSLTDRFSEGDPEGRGRVRAKTGTLTAVTSLAGVAADRDGNLMLFALMADRIAKVDETDARTSLDNAAAALGACRCGS